MTRDERTSEHTPSAPRNTVRSNDLPAPEAPGRSGSDGYMFDTAPENGSEKPTHEKRATSARPKPSRARINAAPALDDRQVWQQVQAHLREHDTDLCRAWFTDLTPLGYADASFWIRAHSDTHRDYLRRDCLEAFNDALAAVTERLEPVRFIGPDEPWTPPAPKRQPALTPPPAPKKTLADTDASDEAPSAIEGKPAVPSPAPFAASERAQAERPESLRLNPDFDFQQFVVGPNNRFAHAAAVAVSQRPGEVYNPIFIHGNVGLGKTHLLQAICLEIRRQDPGVRIHYVSCEAFVTHFMEAVRSGEMADFRHEFRDVDMLVIDDIHLLGSRERTQEEFFHTFNALYQSQKQIVLSSDAPPEEIPDLEDRLISRFKWGLVAEIEPPSYETRVAIVHTKAKMRGLVMPDEVAQLVAHHVHTNIRELEGTIVTMQMRANLDGGDLTTAIARETLGKPAAEHDGPTIDHIISVVTDYFNVKRMDVLGKRRLKSVVLPRQVAMYLARGLTRHSLEEIGAHFGGRDHSTVIHAVKVITDRIGQEPEFAERVEMLESRSRRAP